ncbi:hypothetical protein AB0C29_46645 [Actinoplanes sp. NPDC048791]|uniref:ABC transporter permease subunit n=1 Tax=Actinoplanes sp. NPDC048791 TaxID=3154623 RepID=UPI0033E6A2C6
MRPALRQERIVPAAALVLVVVAFVLTPLGTGLPLTTFDVYNALQGFAQIGLLALAVGLTMIAGEFDLSVVGTYAVGGMIAVQAGQSSAVLGLLVAVAVGAAVGAVQGALIAWLRVPSVPVTLAAYIALLGLAYAISGGLSVTFTNRAATLWVDHTIAGVFSPRSLVTLAASCSWRSCSAAPGSVRNCARSAATAGPAGSPVSGSNAS